MAIGRIVDATLRRTGVLGRLQQVWRRDLERASTKDRRDSQRAMKRLDDLAKGITEEQRAGDTRLRAIERRLEEAERAAAVVTDARISAIEKGVAQLALVSQTNDRQAHLVAQWTSRFDPRDICAHVARAVSTAPLEAAPCAHLAIEGLFPADFYELLIESLPTPQFFPSRDPIKMNLRPANFKVVPSLTRLVWEFIDADVTRTIAEAALQRLTPFIHARYRAMFGEEGADTVLALPHRAFGGRLMLRRPGYSQKPHLDPKRASATVLIYGARPGDPEAVGTALYALASPVVPVGTSTFYPQDHGIACTPVAHVPFRPNTAVVFVNAEGAHGAEIPKDVASDDLRRYAFMHYIGPDVPQLLEFVSTLPPADQQGWLGLAGWVDE
jgi:hypothetical protein